jgi:hypothetical protein
MAHRARMSGVMARKMTFCLSFMAWRSGGVDAGGKA